MMVVLITAELATLAEAGVGGMLVRCPGPAAGPLPPSKCRAKNSGPLPSWQQPPPTQLHPWEGDSRPAWSSGTTLACLPQAQSLPEGHLRRAQLQSLLRVPSVPGSGKPLTCITSVSSGDQAQVKWSPLQGQGGRPAAGHLPPHSRPSSAQAAICALTSSSLTPNTPPTQREGMAQDPPPKTQT